MYLSQESFLLKMNKNAALHIGALREADPDLGKLHAGTGGCTTTWWTTLPNGIPGGHNDSADDGTGGSCDP